MSAESASANHAASRAGQSPAAVLPSAAASTLPAAMPTPAPYPTPRKPAPDPELERRNAAILARLREIADRYLAENAIQQATEIYFAMVKSYPDTSQAEMARARLMTIARKYEHSGARHQARSLYERLL